MKPFFDAHFKKFMYKKLNHYLLFLAIFSLTAACRTKKEVVVAPTPKPIEKPIVDPSTVFLEKVNQTILKPKFFNGKAKISFVYNGNSLDFDAVIQFRSDSAILVVAKKFGFEAARALITPDSFFVINRIQQDYMAQPLSAISKKLNLPPRYDLIQDMLIGNPMNISKKPYKVQLKDSLAMIYSGTDAIDVNCFYEKKSISLVKTNINNVQNNDDVTLEFSDYRPFLNQKFSYSRNILAKSKANGELDADIIFTEVEFDKPKVIRFEIPKKYKRLD
jgi:hypothetical protein